VFVSKHAATVFAAVLNRVILFASICERIIFGIIILIMGNIEINQKDI
jgi:hypothetical protein